jgi:CheY-like chemotaxis protein
MEFIPNKTELVTITLPDFIFIDDDSLTLKVQEIILQRILPQANIRTFTEPEEGLAYINSTYRQSAANRVALFLDINMNDMDGWEMMDALQESFGGYLLIDIFMLSSSIDISDEIRAEAIPMVVAFISKPLSIRQLTDILSQYCANMDCRTKFGLFT